MPALDWTEKQDNLNVHLKCLCNKPGVTFYSQFHSRGGATVDINSKANVQLLGAPL